MKCPACQHENRPGAKFCEECAAGLSRACPNCGSAVSDSAKLCPECAHPLTAASVQTRFASPKSYTPKHLAERILTSKSALEGERKQVTVLFCDVAGSTALAERLGADAMHGVLNAFFELALAEIHRYEGTINQFLGDGFMALFGAPVAHEDHARRAVLAALAVQEALRQHREALGAAEPGRIEVRMGVNSGMVVVGKIGDNLRMDYTAIGDTTNLAARLQQLTQPGEISLSEATHRLVERYVECEVLGERRVKGKAEPVVVYRVVAARARPEPRRRESRPIASPLVGRDTEVATLMRCLDRLVAGQGGIVCVVGEAGLGKSRLVTEVSASAANRGALSLEGRALSFGRTLSYWPFLEILRRWASITEEDSEVESQKKLACRIEALLPDEVADVLPYVTTLLGLPVPAEFEHRVKYLDGQAMGRQVFRSTRRLFERLATTRPVALVFEDLHWADRSSAELIEHLLPLTGAVPLLLCGVGRPDRESPAARLRDVAQATYGDRYTEIALAPLSPATRATLLDNLLAHSQAAARLRDRILAQTEGNPFFVEEVVRSLVTAGTLAWDSGAGEWRLTRDIERVTIPDTLQGVITARIDRLDEGVKQALKIASVIGRSFFYRVLRAIGEVGEELDRHLVELQQLELVREKRRVPELEYFFKHALVQEATYESILIDRRGQLHRLVGECIERLFADRLEEFYGVLAYHYASAEDWQKAQDYLFKAGDHAGRVAADAEALVHYRQAIDAFTRAFGSRWDPLQRAVIERKIGEALYRRGVHQEALEYLNRALELLGAPYPTSRRGVRLALARELLRQVGHRLLPNIFLRATPDLLDVAAEERSSVYLSRGWIDTFGEQENLLLDTLLLLNHSERHGLVTGIARASAAVGFTCDLLGWFGVASRYHRRAVAIANQVKQPTTMGLAHLALGLHERYIGQWDEAGNHLRRAAATYHAAGDLRGWGTSSAQIMQLEFFRGRFAPAMEQALELTHVGQDAGDPLLFGWGLWGQALVEGHSGELDAAVTRLEQVFEIMSSIPSYWDMVAALGLLGSYLARQGRLIDAVSRLETGERLITERGLRGHGTNYVWNALAETYLVAAEGRQGRNRNESLGTARRACQQAFRHGQRTTTGLATAIRLYGRYEWLKGRPSKANQWWRRSLTVAEKLDARYELGMTHLEIWQRTGEPRSRESAELILSQIGASALLAQRPPG